MALAIDYNAASRWDNDDKFIDNINVVFNALTNSRAAGRLDDQKILSDAEDLACQLVYLYARDFPDMHRKTQTNHEQRMQEVIKAMKHENKPGGLMDQAVSSMIDTLSVDETIEIAYKLCLRRIASQEYRDEQEKKLHV